jgi:hypothetical protein
VTHLGPYRTAQPLLLLLLLAAAGAGNVRGCRLLAPLPLLLLLVLCDRLAGVAVVK